MGEDKNLDSVSVEPEKRKTSSSISIPEPCHKCGWKLRRSDCATIEDGITHCICYNCGQEWVE